MKYLNCHVVQSGSKPMFTTVHSITEDTSLRDGFTLRIHLASQLEGGQHQISIKTPLRNSIVRKVLQEIIGDDGNYIEYQFDRNSAALADGYYFIAYSHGSNKTETELLFKLSNTRLLSTLDSNSVKFVTLAENLQDLYYEHRTGKFFFLSSNGTQVPVDLPAEDVPSNIYLDTGTVELVFELSDGSVKKVNVSPLIDNLEKKEDADILKERVDIVEEKVDVIGLDYKEYGVREVVGQTSSTLQRVTRHFGEIKVGTDTGLVANVALNDAIVTNSFDSIPIFAREKVEILAPDGISNIFVKVKKYYIKEEWVTEGGTNYHYWWMCSRKLDGYRTPLPFIRPNESERDFTYIGAYEATLDANTKLRSLPNLFPRVSYSRSQFRTAARKLDTNDTTSKYQITDLAEYVDLVQIPMMIEFATKNMQSILYGFAAGQYAATHLSLLAETDVNRVVLTNAQGALYRVGQSIDIGTSLGDRQVAQDRLIISITPDTPSAGQSEIVFDGAAITTTTSHIVYNVAWKTGTTDIVVSSSGFVTTNDGKYPCVWRGIENPYGNIWKNVDGLKISNYRGWVCTDPSQYNDTASAGGDYAYPYQPLSFLNASANGYVKELGFDQRFPFANLPIDTTGGNGTFYSDYYYQNTGDRTAFVGGSWYLGVYAGPFCWSLGHSLGGSYLIVGARLSYRP